MKDIILVDKDDNEIGKGEKMAVHLAGQLHRAFSIFIFNSQGEMMLQRRASTKYHSPGLWTNACCSHPRPGESLEQAAKRRLKEEMGFECDLQKVFSFIYKAKVEDLTEHEFDHVFIGKFDQEPVLNKEEADGWKWIELKQLIEDIIKNPKEYTCWFKIILTKLYDK
ncbi:isopentenyl-diphosphate Delta-isomerase [Candidatus Parcubacteria bacterium]|nr:isopentenyl-diphosphate Delta-isomerase [Candidatus Parcubacteria bacterium]